ncbi:ADP-ribosylglycohydrolase [Olavius algarvensis Delta 1 endosymbiont]|nr:ADP-ribosylglycohydrolase [Olavius algarvensis Delta 1 endosymbiont]
MAHTHIVGCILGTAVGDAIGLPYEGLSRRRAAKLFGKPEGHHFFFGRGMVSDDTEHTCMVAQSLIASGGEVDSFRRHLGWRFRFWLLGLPAGIGMATLRSTLRLWIGFGPRKSGVFSAGNGPAMRAAILGAAIDDPQSLRELVQASTRITHTDPKAEFGAFAVALAAQLARQNETVVADYFLDQLRSSLGSDGDELSSLIENAAKSAENGQSTESFADSLGLSKGVSGYVYHSVPVAIHAWFAHQHYFRAAVTSVIQCGGDTDSTGAIVGGIVGTTVGKNGIPAEWLNHLFEWPLSVSWMERLGVQVDSSIGSDAKDRPIALPVWGLLPRNLFFLLVVLYHGLRRLFPPY